MSIYSCMHAWPEHGLDGLLSSLIQVEGQLFHQQAQLCMDVATCLHSF